MTEVKVYERVELPLSSIEPNWFNANVMTAEEFDVLVLDMKTTGPQHELVISPIWVSPKNVFYNDPDAEPGRYVIIDGEHRWKAAQKANWQTIPCEIHIIGEDLARILNYRKNRERGHIDAWREADLFKWEADRGLTHERIAQAYMVDRTTVTKRLSLFKITDETKKILKDVPHGTLKVSHFEPLATLKPEVQKDAAEMVVKSWQFREGEISVDHISNIAERANRDYEKRKRLEEELPKAKYPKCPQCKQPPSDTYWKGLPYVECKQGHNWNIKTGKPYKSQWEIEREKEREAKPNFIKTIRSITPVKHFNEAIQEYVKKIVPQFSDVQSIRINGIFTGAKADFDISIYSNSTRFHYEIGGKGRSVKIESMTYRTGEVTKISEIWPEPQTSQEMEEVKKFLEDLLGKNL